MLKAGSFVVVPSFAVTELHLKGNELFMFSIVWGFSQDGESWFTGTRAYLAEWCGCSKVTVTKALSSLCERGFLEKRVRTESGITLCDYAVPKGLYPQAKSFTTPVKKLNGGGKESLLPPVKKLNPNNIKTEDSNILIEKGGVRAARFTPPTPEQLSDYCIEAGISIDRDRFLDHYAANGWKVGGRAPMRDWRAAVRNWAKNDSSWAKPKPAPEREEAMPWL